MKIIMHAFPYMCSDDEMPYKALSIVSKAHIKDPIVVTYTQTIALAQYTSF